MKKLILFGGAFDPIHLGHLNMAKNASEQLDSDVLFIPANISVWKETSLSKEHKMKIIELATKNNPRFYISDYELSLPTPVNYTINTIKHFLNVYPNTKLYFLMGADQVNQFHRWQGAEEIAELVQLVYYHRPRYKTDMRNVKKYHMLLIKGKEIDVSSTEIKEFECSGLPFEVIQYIEDHNLYYMPRIKALFDSEKRYKHSISVAHLAYDIACANHFKNPIKAYIAGLLHDSGKAIVGEKALKIMNESYPEYLEIGSWSYHQFIGEKIAKEDFKITDKSMLNAIKFHATGNKKMDLLAKIIYASDKIDPLRGFDSKELIVEMKKNAEKGFIKVLKANKDYLEINNKSINNQLTYNCFKHHL